jgi:mono/diheme cytochrome c family protein
VSQKESVLGDATLGDAWQMAARQHAPGVILAAAAEPASNQSGQAQNLIADPGFSTNSLVPWTLRAYKTERPGTVELSISPGGRNGGTALKISSPFTADVGAGANIAVKPHTRYRFGGWVRTENLKDRGGKGAMFNLHGGNASNGISGTRDWSELSIEFHSGDKSEVLLHCLFGGFGGGIGTAWYDDLFLYQIDSGNISGSINDVTRHFASHGDPAARAALASALNSRTDDFSKATAAALAAAPTKPTALVRKNTPDAAIHNRGLAVYNRTCIACHGPEGKGVPGAFPPLDGSSWALGDPTIPARILLLGLAGPIEVSGQKYENIMPPHNDLKDSEIADVLTYVRQAWSNDAPAVSTEIIQQTRTKFASRGKPWTAAELK